MTPNADEKLTIAAYDNQTTHWVDQHQTPNFWEKEMDKFQELLPAGKILEIGSGGGRDAKELVYRGFSYIGTDASTGLIKEAKRLNPKATFLVQSVYDLDFPQNTFDGFWASAVLLHIPKSKIDKALIKIKQVVKPNGIGFFSIKDGEGERMVTEDAQIGDMGSSRLFSFYSRQEFEEVLKINGYKVEEFQYRPMNEKTKWLIFFVRVMKQSQLK